MKPLLLSSPSAGRRNPVGRLALLLALTVALGLPLGYASLAYTNLASRVDRTSQAKAGVITQLVSDNPELWVYQTQRLEELLARVPLPLDGDTASVFDASGTLLISIGNPPDWPLLRRSHALYDSGRAVGRVEIAQSLRPVINNTAIAALLSLLLGGEVFISLRRMNASLDKEQESLRESEARFRGLVEQSIAGIYIIQDGRLVYANQRFAQILGYDSIDEPIGRDALSMVIENERAAVAEITSRWLKGEASHIEYSTTGLRKDGSTVELGVHGARASYRGRPAIIGMLQDISEKKRAEVQIRQYIAQLENSFMQAVKVATTLSEMRDPYTAGHEVRVAEIAVAIGVELGFDARRAEGLRVAGYLHDIGKIVIPAEILAKPTKLSPIEYQLIQGHPQAGYEVLKNVEIPWPVAQVTLQHHERMDGTGYPQGLKGDAILLEARIIAVADVVEAMSSHRPYRPGLGIEKALAEIERGRGTAYDPDVADACLRLFREKGYTIPDLNHYTSSDV